MNKLCVMVGLPGSGKSTLAQILVAAHGFVVHSSDVIRFELYKDYGDTKHNNEVFNELHRRIKTDLMNGKNVIYDATNISMRRRMAFLREIKRIPGCEKIAIVVATPYEMCLERNKKREHQVPESVIARMYRNFYIPQLYEGWDAVNFHFPINLPSMSIDEYLDALSQIPQDNPYHTLTIGDHCKKCAEIASEMDTSPSLYYAALLHDIGKRFTKQFTTIKGEPTTIAHYYQHHLVSAYEAMFYLRGVKDINYENTLAYIMWHMKPYMMKTEKEEKAFIGLVGQAMYDKVMILHEADKLAK